MREGQVPRVLRLPVKNLGMTQGDEVDSGSQ